MIYLTGGTGLLGLHILDALRSRGEPVRALARTGAAAATLALRGAEPHLGDVTEAASWREVMGVRAIVHSAAMILSKAPWPEYERVNVGSTRLAVETALRLGVPLVHISSVAVYGPRLEDAAAGSVAEDFPFGPRDRGEHYARSKRLAEDVVWEGVSRGLQAVALRPCVVYGRGDRLFMPNVLRYARTGYFPVVGAGREPMALVEAGNVAGAVAATLTAPPAAWGRAYNLTNDDAISVPEFVAALAQGLGRPVRPVHLPAGMALGLGAVVDWLGSVGGRQAPGIRAALRFLAGGNPFTSQAAVATLGWQPATRHRDGIPAALRTP